MQNHLAKKKNNLFVLLCCLFLTNALLAEVIGVKIFSLEAFLGLPPAQINFFNHFKLDFNLTAGAMLWPLVFITTDVINEYFGKEGVRKISIITASLISYAFIIFWLIGSLPPAQFWLDVNATDSLGNPLNINEAFNRIFRQSMGIIIGSLVAFLIGQVLDVTVFQFLRRITGSRNVWMRATGSTMVSQLVDSFIVLTIAFYFFGNPAWSLEQVLAVGIINYAYKVSVALLSTPILYGVLFIIERYLGKENSAKMSDEASETKIF